MTSVPQKTLPGLESKTSADLNANQLFSRRRPLEERLRDQKLRLAPALKENPSLKAFPHRSVCK